VDVEAAAALVKDELVIVTSVILAAEGVKIRARARSTG
jgi:hypothetical protein